MFPSGTKLKISRKIRNAPDLPLPDPNIIHVAGILDATTTPDFKSLLLPGSDNSVDSSRPVVIEAEHLQITPEGITQWIEMVHRDLMSYQLSYSQSQLAMILDHDDRYHHPQTIFPNHYQQ